MPVPSFLLACSNRSRSKSTRARFLRIQPRRRSAQHLPDGLLNNVSLYPLCVRAVIVDRESSMLPWPLCSFQDDEHGAGAPTGDKATKHLIRALHCVPAGIRIFLGSCVHATRDANT